MSKRHAPVSLVIEWSPKSVTVYDGQSNSKKIANTLGELVGYSGREVVMAVSPRSVFVRSTRVPNAAHDEIRTVLQVRMADLFPIASTDLAFDFEVTPDVNQDGRLAVVVAMPSGELRRLLDEAKAAGLKVSRVVPASIGSAILAEGLAQRDAAVVQPVEGGLAIDIISEGYLRASRVAASTSVASAEVSRTYSVASLPCGRIVAAGGLLLEDADVRTQASSLSAISTAWSDKLPINLEPPERVAARARAARSNRIRLAGLTALAAALVFAVAWTKRSDEQKVVDDKTAALSRSYTHLKTIESAEETSATKGAASAAILERAFQPAQSISDSVELASNQTPAGLWLSGITAERGKPILLRGTATSTDAVYAYLDNLKAATDFADLAKSVKEPRLRDVKLVFANTAEIEQKPVVNFSISAFPVGNLPLLDQDQKKS